MKFTQWLDQKVSEINKIQICQKETLEFESAKKFYMKQIDIIHAQKTLEAKLKEFQKLEELETKNAPPTK